MTARPPRRRPPGRERGPAAGGDARAGGAWTGYGRFARACCGVEPEVLAKAWRLLDGDPTPEVLGLYPKAEPDAEAADGWYASLGGSWRRRFDGG